MDSDEERSGWFSDPDVWAGHNGTVCLTNPVLLLISQFYFPPPHKLKVTEEGRYKISAVLHSVFRQYCPQCVNTDYNALEGAALWPQLLQTAECSATPILISKQGRPTVTPDMHFLMLHLYTFNG